MGAHHKPLLLVDFYRTLSMEKFWQRVTEEEHALLDAWMSNHHDTVCSWMRGELTAEDIHVRLAAATGLPYEYLWDVFCHGCAQISVSTELQQALHTLQPHYTVVLCTDNMDSFTRYTMPAWGDTPWLDGAVVSHQHGMLKTDAHGGLLTQALRMYGATAEATLLIDDSSAVRDAFARIGGTALATTSPQETLQILRALARDAG